MEQNKLKQSKHYILQRNIILTFMALPALIIIFMFTTVPLYGIQLAFKDYNYLDGIWKSPWCGLKNFEFYFKSVDAWTTMRNTLLYSLATLLFVNVISGVIIALLLYEVRGKYANKLCQTSMLLPSFVSVIAISYIVSIIFGNSDYGIINSIRTNLGLEAIDFYLAPKYWPFIIIGASAWQWAGMAGLYDYGALLAVDPTLYEAAELDGANWFQKVKNISLPAMSSMICMTLITRIGSVLNSGLSNMYLSNDSGALYSATYTLDYYTFKALTGNNIGTSAAVGLFKSVIGIILVFTANSIVKKIDSNKAIY